MFEAHEEEEHDWHPHGHHLGAGRGRDHCADHAHGNHPVAQHATNEDGEPSIESMFFVAKGPSFADMSDLLRDFPAINAVAIGQNEGHHEGDGQCTSEVAEKDQSPVAHNLAEGDAGAFVDECEGNEGEDSGKEIEFHQVEHNETHGEQNGTGKR